MYLRVFLFALILINTLVSSNFKDEMIKDLKLKSIELQDNYCANVKDGEKLCLNRSLSYPNLNEPTTPKDLKVLASSHIKEIIKNFKEHSSKEMIKEELGGYSSDYTPTGKWYEKIIVEIPFLTRGTYTISIYDEAYLGGAHPSYSLEFRNYDRRTNKEIKLEDILLPNAKRRFKQIAKSYYKHSVGLKPNEPLTKDGWFEDKFVLPSNFAITKEGLLLYYNPYEIKSFVFGETKFILPYRLFKDLINPSSPIR